MADKIFPWTELEPEAEDYLWDCIDTEITELPDLISWCLDGRFFSLARIYSNIDSGNIKQNRNFNISAEISSDISSDISFFIQSNFTSPSGGDDGYVPGEAAHDDFVDSYSQVHMGYSAWVAYPWFRFKLDGISSGTVIDEAKIAFDASHSQTKAMTANWYVEDVDNSIPQLVSKADYWSRVWNATPVFWNPESWIGGNIHYSPDLAPLIQYIIDKPGWVAGNYIQFFMARISGIQQSSRIAGSRNTAASWPVLQITSS